MAWNESGNGDKKDPWRQGPRKPEGPPDLDDLVRKIRDKINSTLRGVRGNNKGPVNINSGGGKPGSHLGYFSVGTILIGLLIIWLLSGIFIVSPMKRGVVQLFGKYSGILEPGPHWIPRFIETVTLVNVQEEVTFDYTDQMLTKDENIVDVSVSVMYRRVNAKEYLFNAVDPRESIKQATASALRQVIGNSTLDVILTTGRQQIRDEVKELLVSIMDLYQTGIEVTDVNLQPAKPPEQLTAAFDDVIKAREDEQRYIGEAQAYDAQVRATVRGKVVQLIQEAEADQKRVVADAQADVAHFLALLPQYNHAPEIMRQRLYLDAYESMLSKSSKVLVNLKGGNNVIYLPIDKLISQQNAKPKEDAPASTISAADEAANQPVKAATNEAEANDESSARGGYTWHQ
ncbi:MAG: FtsH protease activity modulator HflK [Pseudomonadota bacterium]|nr:FtsH protease activity modulator HflK [Pseudomonadota bacterium]